MGHARHGTRERRDHRAAAAPAGRYPRRPGTTAIDRLIADRRITDTLTRRDLEDRVTLLDAEHLPRPLVNSEINLAPRSKPETGFRWPHHNLVVELDGYETHATRAAFERNRARDRALRVAGWRVLRITWRQLRNEAAVIAADLRAMLSS